MSEDGKVRELEREFRATVITELRELNKSVSRQGDVLASLQTSTAVSTTIHENLTRDVIENKGNISKLKSDNLKIRGAGILAGFLLSAKFLWEGLLK